MASLVDTNVLVYRFDRRFPDKQRLATELLRSGIADGSVVVPHQAIVEFVAVVTRPLEGAASLLDAADGRREAEELLSQFEVLYPDQELVRIALRGAAAYQLSWFDATCGPMRSGSASPSCSPRTSRTAGSTARSRPSTRFWRPRRGLRDEEVVVGRCWWSGELLAGRERGCCASISG